MSLTYLKDKGSNNILYDWRSPICSLFYDYEIGPCEYEAPGGVYKGELKRKRQYKIENDKKNKARIVKHGFGDSGKQLYAIKYQKKIINVSVDKKKLEKICNEINSKIN